MPQFWSFSSRRNSASTKGSKRHEHRSLHSSAQHKVPEISQPFSAPGSVKTFSSNGGSTKTPSIQDPSKALSPKDSAKDLSDVIPTFNQLELNEKLERIQNVRTPLERRPTHQRPPLRQRPPSPPPPGSDVLIVGAGPAGLMLACNLIRFGIDADVIDNRSDRTATGRADGLAPKTIETLRQMRLADRLLLKGVRVYDIHFWRSTPGASIHRMHKEVYFPASLDCLDPYLLLAHQGFVEDVFLKDIMERGVDVKRSLTFVDYRSEPGQNPIEVVCKSNTSQAKRNFCTRYLVGCDGAHSNVRKAMGARPVGSSTDAVWGVIDGVLETDFPDLFSKTVIYNEDIGSVLLFPRERNMTRLYIQIKKELIDGASKEELDQEFIMRLAEEVLEPYTLRWKHVEWLGRYHIGQKIASKFQDDDTKVFIAGDATHTQSPNASQGMNHSMHDSWNLGWKLNLAVRGLAKPALLATYEEERRQVAEDIIDFDYEHSAALASGDAATLIDDFRSHIRFISGYGAEYAPNVLNVPQKGCVVGNLRVGSLLPPAKVTRKIDSNPVDLQLDIPMLGQFRLFFFARNIEQHTCQFLEVLSAHALSPMSVMGRLTSATNASYMVQPPIAAKSDEFIRPERYTTVSGLFTFAIIIQCKDKKEFEIEALPTLWKESPFTVYVDDVAHMDTQHMSCSDKWLGAISGSEVGIVVVRPDGYVGTVGRFVGRSKENGAKAAKWLDDYFDRFLTAGN